MNHPTRTQAIARFLKARTHDHLADLYNPSMEVQVNVAQDGGERIEGEYRGKNWRGWTDGIITWKPFRIPRNANTIPEYTDVPMTWPLDEHVEAIGMTGWDWENKVSRWVAYDFDDVTGHASKGGKTLSPDELEQIRESVMSVPWVTVLRSTGGNGLHLYVFLEPEATANHNEHAALARAILGKLSALTGYDFHAKVDICGGNMWVWHRKMAGTAGLTILKEGGILAEMPANWQDHIDVVRGQRKRTTGGQISSIDELAGQRQVVNLDDEHRKLLEYLDATKAVWWWEQDYHMLVTHTCHLQDAHAELGMKGVFRTNSAHSSDQNCFAFPLRNGAWVVRRYTPGVAEDPSWEQDSGGWTKCYLNKIPDLREAARFAGGIEDKKGGFNFTETEVAVGMLSSLGVNLEVRPRFCQRHIRVTEHKDGRFVLEMDKQDADPVHELEGWLSDKKHWTRIVGSVRPATLAPDYDQVSYDQVIRHLITGSGEDYGWAVFSDEEWHVEPLVHIKAALSSSGIPPAELNQVIGGSVFKPWRIVVKPFEPEYPGDREWNRNAAAFNYKPADKSAEMLSYPTWTKVLNHTGSGLDKVVADDPWCQIHGIHSGGDYLKVWIACMFQKPYQPLPYLFFFGPQNSGKSIFHEALSLLLLRGYVRADNALVNQQGFNAELEGQILCVVEETDLRTNKGAYNRIKDWVTSNSIQVHAKGATPYHNRNTTHWVQCANSHQYCPIFRGDTRITAAFVKELDPFEVIPKMVIEQRLAKEAPDFLAEVLKLEIPDPVGRLMIPVLETDDKLQIADMNRDELEAFLDDMCIHAPGYWVKFSDFYDKFQASLDANELGSWSKIRVGKNLPTIYPKGRNSADAQHYIGNLAFKGFETIPSGKKYIKDGAFLRLVDDKTNL